MIKDRKEFNRQETQKHIRSVFFSLYKEKGIDAVSVNEICKEAGIAKSTFYFYFDDKYSVLEAIENDLLEGLKGLVEDIHGVDIGLVSRGLPIDGAEPIVVFIKENMDEFKVILGPRGDASFESRWRQNISRKFMELFIKEMTKSANPGLSCSIFSSALIGAYRYYIFDKPDTPVEDVAVIIGNTYKYALMDFQK